ncbi:hypothetical protein [Paenibacillus paeoniae]|uniref:Uncharacterized protein n=1 Tax=Paenibacillus paeoniae TaxID=2292705 RepID=A0A371P0J1_9BACL|nr:hypothetical protein [Paenibacillus paeoniae]REK69449.1 hypothetical protein DX130_23340 [Paenibacillus paeoniae]
MKQAKQVALIMIIVLTMIIAGCSSSAPPKAALEAATAKTMAAESYKLSMTLQLDELDFPDTGGSNIWLFTPTQIAGIVKDATIKADVTYASEPMRADVNLEVILPSMMDMKLVVPMILTEKKLYIQVPALPLFGIPDSVVGKYLQFDLDDLAKQEGADKLNLNIVDLLKMMQDLFSTLMKHADEKTYFSNVKAEEAGLPKDLKVDQIVKFAIDEDQYPQTVETIIKALPEILDILMNNEAYLQAAGIEKADLEEMKANLDTKKTELLNLLQNDLKFNALELTGGIKDKYLVYQGGKISVQKTNPESGMDSKFGGTFSAQYSELNKKVEFPELPTDALTKDQLTELFRAAAGL